MSRNPAIWAALVGAFASMEINTHPTNCIGTQSPPVLREPSFDVYYKPRRDRGHPLNPGKARRK